MTSETAWFLLSYYDTVVYSLAGLILIFVMSCALCGGIFSEICEERLEGEAQAWKKPLWPFTWGCIFSALLALSFFIFWICYPSKELLYHYLSPELKKEAAKIYLIEEKGPTK